MASGRNIDETIDSTPVVAKSPDLWTLARLQPQIDPNDLSSAIVRQIKGNDLDLDYRTRLLIRDSIEARHRCCEVRKIMPLRRAQLELGAWICGLRSGQVSRWSSTKRSAKAVLIGLWKSSALAARSMSMRLVRG